MGYFIYRKKAKAVDVCSNCCALITLPPARMKARRARSTTGKLYCTTRCAGVAKRGARTQQPS